MNSSYSMNELRKTDACQKRRNFQLELGGGVTENMRKAASIKSAIKLALNGTLKKEEVEEYLKAAFEDIPYPSDEQRSIIAHDAFRQVARYVGCEERTLLPGATLPVTIGSLTIKAKPDYVHLGQEIEVIKIKTSKPNVTQKAAKEDLGLYSMIAYGRTLVAPGQTKTIKASYYFLRKQNDRAGGDEPNFDEDFFQNTGGRNVVSLVENFTNDGSVPELDKAFLPIAQAFLDGLREEECSQDDCEKCQLFDLCKYNDAPLAIVKTPVVKSVRDLDLTPAQEQVIEYEKGICRVNAGAGAGKTMVVALRTATLLNKGARPEELLLITFTNAGAEEMRSRIKLILDDFGLDVDASRIPIMTFNAFGDMIVKKEYKLFGFTEKPKLIDDVERSRIIADLLNENHIAGLNYRDFDTSMKTCMGALAMARQVFAIVKAGQFSVSDVMAVREKLGSKARFATLEAIEGLIALYDKYDDKLRADGLIEFADQEALLFELLRQDPFYLERFGYKHITVDEFQDTSEGQIKLIKFLRECPSFQSLMVVGDDSQSIFGFRDTTPEYILHFDEMMDCPVDDIFLVENHRSTPEILTAANKMNDKRKKKIDKALVATRPHGKEVVVKGFFSKQEEREFVINEIKKHLDAGEKPENIAILAATRYELMDMADALRKEEVQTVMLNPEPMLDNSRVRAAIALCNAIKNPEDSKDRLMYANALKGNTLITATAEEIKAAIAEVSGLIEAFNAEPAEPDKKALLMQMLEDIDQNEDEVYRSLLETLKAKSLDRLFEYMDDFLRFGSDSAVRRLSDYPGVALATAHSSKGLEWPIVYNMISKYDGPEMHTRSKESREMVEERKRLLFVSMTRARDELVITGQYIAFGKKGDYTYNQFLIDAFDCAGQKVDGQDIELLLYEKEQEEKRAKAAAKEAAKKEEKDVEKASGKAS